MAEKSTELRSVDKLDPITTSAGAEKYELTERSADDHSELEGDHLTADMAEVPEETEQIKAQIEATRNQMGETIDAIQERLSFANISEQVSETVNNAIESAKDSAYDATIGKAVNFMKNVGNGVSHAGTLKVIKNNPLPLALIGVGAGLLVYQSFGSGRGSSRKGNGYDRMKYYDRDETGFGGPAIASAGKSLGSATTKAYEGIADKASAAVDNISGAAGTAYDTVSGAVGSAYTGAEDLAQRAYERAGEFGTVAHERYDQVLEDNPLALGALAVAVGAAVGFAIPSTRYEGQLMGEARENLVARAQDAAGSLVEKAKSVASEAGQTIKEEARAITQ
ncbi:MAG: DUF3618 domain-containing protein [Blastocatellia bacterium]|nr:DUF3618 domain-containing protein [Blastocatellia bacterium]